MPYHPEVDGLSPAVSTCGGSERMEKSYFHAIWFFLPAELLLAD
jgi:hypothetical protein